MPSAIYTETTLSAGFNLAQLTSAVQTAMINAGFSAPIDTFSSLDGFTNYQIFSYEVAPGYTKSTLYLNVATYINSTTIYIYQGWSDNWDAVNNTATGMLTQTYVNISSGYALTFRSYNHPELRSVQIDRGVQTAAFALLGYTRPANIPSWWNQNAFLYAFARNGVGSSSGSAAIFQCVPFYPNPASLNSISATFNCPGTRYNLNPGGFLDAIEGPHLQGNQAGGFSNQWVAGQYSSDLIEVSGQGLSLGAIVTYGLKNYRVLSWSTNLAAPAIWVA